MLEIKTAIKSRPQLAPKGNIMYSKNYAYQLSPIFLNLSVHEGEDDTAALAPAEAAAKADNITLTKADLQKQIQDAINFELKGLKAKNADLISENKRTKDELGNFKGLDVEGFRAYQEKIAGDEDARLISEGKVNQVIERHTQRQRADHMKQVETLNEQLKAANTRTHAYQGRVLENAIRSVAVGLHESAIEDAVLAGTRVFSLDDKGEAVALDAQGHPITGKDGIAAITPKEWMEKQKELKPHWFPASSSGGGAAAGSRDASGRSNTITRSDFEALSLSQKRDAIGKGIKIVDK